MNHQQELTQLTQEFVQAFGSLTEAQLNWKPTPNTWSVGQIVDHLITANSTYFPIFEAIQEDRYPTRFYERLPFLPSFFGKLILKSVQPEAERKTKTVPVFEPTQSNVPADILPTFQHHQETLKEWVGKMEQLYTTNIVITSPAAKVAIYTLEDALKIIVAHEWRHLKQAKNIWNQQQTATQMG